MAYRDGPTILTYKVFEEAADVCGRLPDASGYEEIIDGPIPAPECIIPTEHEDTEERAPRICVITNPRSKEPVSLIKLDRLKEEKLGPIINVRAPPLKAPPKESLASIPERPR
jgi:hypothetical protein